MTKQRDTQSQTGEGQDTFTNQRTDQKRAADQAAHGRKASPREPSQRTWTNWYDLGTVDWDSPLDDVPPWWDTPPGVVVEAEWDLEWQRRTRLYWREQRRIEASDTPDAPNPYQVDYDAICAYVRLRTGMQPSDIPLGRGAKHVGTLEGEVSKEMLRLTAIFQPRAPLVPPGSRMKDT